MKWIIVHLFIFYPNGIPRPLNFLDLMLEMAPTHIIIKFKRNIPKLPWWIVLLKPSTLLPTQMMKDDLNGSRPWRKKNTFCQRIRVGNWFLDRKERTLWSVDGTTWPNLPLNVLLRDINHASLWRDFLNKKASTTLNHFPLFQRWTLFT